MSEETLAKTITQLIATTKPKQSVDVQFFGGEPLLKFSLIRLGVNQLEQAHAEGRIGTPSYNITTNGTLITDEIARFLAAHRFTVCVSVDGKREVNDLQRIYISGKGSFDQAIAGFRKLRQNGCRSVGFLLTPIPSNLPQMAEFFRYAVQELGIDFLSVNTPQPSMRGWGIDGAEYARQSILCHQISKETGVPFGSTLDKVLLAMKAKRGCLSSCFNPQGDRCASVTVDGKLSPCIVAWEKEFLRPLEDLNSPEMFLTEAYEEQRPDCLACPALTVCGGPCHLESTFMKRGGRWDHERCAFFTTAMNWAVTRAESTDGLPG